MNSSDLRQSFLDFFAARDHKIVPAAPLVPKDDPTLLFNSAGMVQFKPYFAGAVPLTFTRAASCQPCLRAGGKDSDLALVGHTLRHHTLFEMLGNFSFGDYFKEEGIQWAWEFLTEVVKLDPARLYATVYKDDDEAADIWLKKMGLPKERLARYDKDNFWGPAGGVGACGPSSEIHYLAGDEFGCGRAECHINCDCDRFIEVYNIVFPQYDQQPDGSRLPLKNRGIDTGMGLERLAFAAQGVKSNFETDLWQPIIGRVEEVLKKSYKDGGHVRSSMNIVADHVRAITFVVAENVLPSNDGRGYVVRKLLRRALLHAYLLGERDPSLHRVVEAVVAVMGGVYPHLHAQRATVEQVIRGEEENYLVTLGRGMDRLQNKLAAMKAGETLRGEDAFVLYDTYGLPLEVAAEVAAWGDVKVDEAAFEEAMAAQRRRSRAARADADAFPFAGNVEDLLPTDFRGYDADEARTQVTRIIAAAGRADGIVEGERAVVVLEHSPFYPEAGGQVGDAGVLVGPAGTFDVDETTRDAAGHIFHHGSLRLGTLAAAENVTARVDRERRRQVERHHTATHLLHAALRETLGPTATQAGSYVGPDYLRFDYASTRGLESREVIEIEGRVNEMVMGAYEVHAEEMGLEEAKGRGAMALFGEKYGERARVVCVGAPGDEVSLELCGGTHLRNTGELGPFFLVREEAVAAGVRRLEAVAGSAAVAYAQRMRATLDDASRVINTGWENLVDRVAAALEDRRELEKKYRQFTAKDAVGRAAEMLAAAVAVGPVRLVTGVLAGATSEAVKDAVSSLVANNADVVAVIATDDGGKATLWAGAGAAALAAGAHAGNLVREVAKALGGGGGGKADFAQAGAKTVTGLAEALAAAAGSLKKMVKP